MNSITLPAHAKVNLTLDVCGKLPNGYHTVCMVMESLELHDEVTVTLTDDGQMKMTCDLSWLPVDETNLAVRAARLFYEKTGIAFGGAEIHVKKRIPVAAGLAGGSTDAAAVLHALNQLHHAEISLDDLCEMGLALGADVPYCLRGGSMLAEGIGEVLSPLPAMPEGYVVLCKPDFSVSTAEIYRQMNGGNLHERPDTAGMLKALKDSDWNGICHRMYNVMEVVTGKNHTEIAEIRDVLLTGGADGAVMSGSGPTVFGLFSDEKAAEKAAAALKERFADTYLTKVLV